MPEHWRIDGPRTIEVGSAQEPVRELKVGLVAGRVDVVAHDDDSAQVEVTRVRGHDLVVSWDDGVLTVAHPQARWDGLLDTLKAISRRDDRAELSIAVPRGTRVKLSTVSADGLVAGLRANASVRTVSGELALDGVHGDVSARTISGRIDVREQHGALHGETVSGSLTVHGVDVPQVSVTTVSGELAIDLQSAPCSVTTKSVSGDLVVRIPSDAGFRIEARSVSGQVVAEGRRLTGNGPGSAGGAASDGDEAVRVAAQSVSGDVTLLRSGAA